MDLRLKDGGVYIDWTGLTDIKAWIYSDAQSAIAGRCTVRASQGDGTVLICEYPGTKAQYLGVNRVIVQARYMGQLKTYDKPVFNFVRWTGDQDEQVTIDDPHVEVEIEVADVSSTILERILAACIKATEEAREVVDVQRGPRGYSAYEVAVQDGFEGTEEEWLASLQGYDGKSAYEIAVEDGFVGTEEEWLASLIGPAGKSAYQEAVDNGFVGTEAQWLASLVGPTGKSAYQSALDNGFVGTEAEWLASLVGPQGLSAYQVAVAAGFEGSVSDWLASLVGPPGPTPNFTIGTVTTGQPGSPVIVTITGTAANPVLNFTIPRGFQGNSGSSVAFPYLLVNNLEDGGEDAALSAEMGKYLQRNIKLVYDSLGAAAFWGEKPVIDWTGNAIPVSLTLTNCSSSNMAANVQLGDSYSTLITPDAGNILASVVCTMNGSPVTVVNGQITIAEVTGAIVISAVGANLDSIAYESLSYKAIFETNNSLGISPGFDNGSYSPLTIGAGSPTITSDEHDTGNYSLKASGTSSAQVRTSGTFTNKGFVACRVKVTSWTAGYCGAQYNSINAGANYVTDGWETKAIRRSDTSPASAVFIGSYSSANLTGYVDSPVFVKDSVFTTVPSLAKFTELYEQYIAIKKAS